MVTKKNRILDFAYTLKSQGLRRTMLPNYVRPLEDLPHLCFALLKYMFKQNRVSHFSKLSCTGALHTFTLSQYKKFCPKRVSLCHELSQPLIGLSSLWGCTSFINSIYPLSRKIYVFLLSSLVNHGCSDPKSPTFSYLYKHSNIDFKKPLGNRPVLCWYLESILHCLGPFLHQCTLLSNVSHHPVSSSASRSFVIDRHVFITSWHYLYVKDHSCNSQESFHYLLLLRQSN